MKLTLVDPQSHASPSSFIPFPQAGSVTVVSGLLSRHRPSSPAKLVCRVSTLHELQILGVGFPRVAFMMHTPDGSPSHRQVPV